ncbi:hypothetical protein R3X26_08715 [Vibrio sp. TH_r3]|nr:hypothetical protein [Vibrio sp. TH_r3]MDV7104483.1 hypothetical protein [Vibrio sp. TH_r3]
MLLAFFVSANYFEICWSIEDGKMAEYLQEKHVFPSGWLISGLSRIFSLI